LRNHRVSTLGTRSRFTKGKPLKFLILAFALLLVVAPLPTRADGLAQPSGRVILTITGKIAATNADGAAVFDLAMLDAMARRTTTAETPWFDKAHRFEGTLLSAVLDAAGATGRALRVQAINGYEAIIPLEDVAAYQIILATRIDGKELSVRDKGPLFVIYPFDDHPELYNEVYFNRSVWQVETVEVL
jgi:hypothetical protein